MIRLLAIDPGASTGWAAFDAEGRLLDAGVLKAPSPRQIQEHLRRLAGGEIAIGAFDAPDPPTILIEATFHGFPGSLVALTERRTEWGVVASLDGWAVEHVAVSTWQAHAGLPMRGIERADRKRLIVEKAGLQAATRVRAGEEVVRALADAADAVLIGCWWFETEGGTTNLSKRERSR